MVLKNEGYMPKYNPTIDDLIDFEDLKSIDEGYLEDIDQRMVYVESKHFSDRKVERNLSEKAKRFILIWGRRFTKNGAIKICIIKSDLPEDILKDSIYNVARRWTIISSHKKELITCFKRSSKKEILYLRIM